MLSSSLVSLKASRVCPRCLGCGGSRRLCPSGPVCGDLLPLGGGLSLCSWYLLPPCVVLLHPSIWHLRPPPWLLHKRARPPFCAPLLQPSNWHLCPLHGLHNKERHHLAQPCCIPQSGISAPLHGLHTKERDHLSAHPCCSPPVGISSPHHHELYKTELYRRVPPWCCSLRTCSFPCYGNGWYCFSWINWSPRLKCALG